MKRRYSRPKLTKYDSLAELPERFRHLILFEPTVIHEVFNQLQVITSQCEILEQTRSEDEDRLRMIREATSKIHRSLVEQRKKSA